MKRIFGPLLFLIIILLTACGGNPQSEKKVAAFSFVNQHGMSFGTEQLQDQIWIANFVFTNCTTVCPTMTFEMAKLQERFSNEGIEAEFISFTVDPTVDTPNILRTYIQNFTNDDSNWHLLTGYSQQELETFAREQFQTIVQKPSTSNQVIHGTNFYLVNKERVLVKEYNYIDASYVEEMIQDLQKMK